MIAKLFASLSNMAIARYDFSIYHPVREALSSLGLTSWNAQSGVCGLIVLIPAIAVGWAIARFWYQTAEQPVGVSR